MTEHEHSKLAVATQRRSLSRRARLVAATAVIGGGIVIASVAPIGAVTGYKVAWTGSGLNVRTGPGTTQATLGRLADGTQLDLRCFVRGELVNGRNNVWYQLNAPHAGGFVTASYVTTPSDPLPGLPQCGSGGTPPPLQGSSPCLQGGCAPAASTPATPSTVSRAVNWARAQVGQVYASPADAAVYSDWAPGPTGEWSGDCIKFVHRAYALAGVNIPRGHASQVYEAYRNAGRISTSGNPPEGALVFWDVARPYGHVAISIGGGQVIGTRGLDFNRLPIQQYAVGAIGNYRGWVMPV